MFPYILAGMTGVVALIMSILQAIKRLRESEAMISKSVARKDAQSDRVKRAARATLGMAREIEAANRRAGAIDMACSDLEERLKAIGLENKRLMVFDDRRTKADIGWVIKLANPEYASKVNSSVDPLAMDGWRKGRRYLVWAMDEDKAREKILARYPEKRGFYVQKVERYAR